MNNNKLHKQIHYHQTIKNISKNYIIKDQKFKNYCKNSQNSTVFVKLNKYFLIQNLKIFQIKFKNKITKVNKFQQIIIIRYKNKKKINYKNKKASIIKNTNFSLLWL